jgi:hypothetical protein
MRALLLTIVLLFCGCESLNRAFTPPESGGNSPAVEVGEKIAPFAGPWGEIGLLALIAIQNGFLAKKKIAAKWQNVARPGVKSG